MEGETEPSADRPASGSTPATERGFGLVKGLKICLLLWILLMVAAIGSSAMQLDLLADFARGTRPSSAAIAANETREMIIGGLMLTLFLLTAVLFLVWQAGTNSRFRTLGFQGMSFSPGWSVGWWFIPIANLFQPCRAMGELDRLARSGGDRTAWASVAGTGLVGAWWVFFLLEHLVGRWSFMRMRGAQTIDDFQAATWANLVSAGLSVVTAMLAISLVDRIADGLAGIEAETGTTPEASSGRPLPIAG